MSVKIKTSTIIIISITALILAAGLWFITTYREAESEQPPSVAVEEEQMQFANYLSPLQRNYEPPYEDPDQAPQEPGQRANILLAGFDQRGLSDAIVIVSYDIETFESAIISIKRDTYVDFQTWSEEGLGHSALGWASYVGMNYGGDDYLGGAKLLTETVEQLLDIRITSYAGITFEGLIRLIDLIGGVTVDVAPGFAERSGQKLTPGRQDLSGEETLVYARHRKNPRIPEPGSVSSDGDRIRRHHQLLKAVFEQLETLSTEELLEIFEKLDQELYTNMDDWDLLTLANIFYNHDPRLTEALVLPGELRTVYEYQIEEEFEYYFLDYEECDRVLSELGLK